MWRREKLASIFWRYFCNSWILFKPVNYWKGSENLPGILSISDSFQKSTNHRRGERISRIVRSNRKRSCWWRSARTLLLHIQLKDTDSTQYSFGYSVNSLFLPHKLLRGLWSSRFYYHPPVMSFGSPALFALQYVHVPLWRTQIIIPVAPT